MSKVTNVKVEEGILSYSILTKTSEENIKIDLSVLNEKLDGFIEYQNKYFIGGFNIVLIVKIGDNERVFRISYKPIENIDKIIERVENEINMMYNLKDTNIGIDIYFPEKNKINDAVLKNNNGKFHVFSLIEYCKNGSVYDYITNPKNDLEKKKTKIDEIFVIVKELIKNNIYCSDIKFRNFVVNNEEKVKFIDVADCRSLDLSYKLIYENLIYIQIFHNCPDILSVYFASKLDPLKIYTIYTQLHDDDKIYKNNYYINLIKNVIWYYHNSKKIEVHYENITDIVTEFSVTELNILYTYPTKIFSSKEFSKYIPYIKYYLFLVFLNVIKYFKDDIGKTTFFDTYKYKVDKPDRIIKTVSEDDSPSMCKILDGKRKKSRSRKRKKSRSQKIKKSKSKPQK